MPACPSCGRENPADARFCNACGAAVTDAKGDVALATRTRRRFVDLGIEVE